MIYGGNAQGKTNLLEGIWLFTGGHSFRGAKDTELPRLDPATGKNTSGTALELDFFSEERDQSAILQIENGRRTSWINDVKKNSGTALVGKVRAVIFSPEHLLLIKEGPNHRRNYVDTALCQINPGYAALLSNYRKALMQRNALLKEMAKSEKMDDTLDLWNARIVKFGARVMLERKDFIENIQGDIQDIYSGIARGREKIQISYCPSVKECASQEKIENVFSQELERTMASDARMGFTSVGPHRDDLAISIDGNSARTYGSQGQQRSAVLAMKLAEAKALMDFSGEPPIILLDDVMSELDQERQDYLLNHLQGQQVFITCCSRQTVNLMENGMRFRVENGTVFPEEI